MKNGNHPEEGEEGKTQDRPASSSDDNSTIDVDEYASRRHADGSSNRDTEKAADDATIATSIDGSLYIGYMEAADGHPKFRPLAAIPTGRARRAVSQGETPLSAPRTRGFLGQVRGSLRTAWRNVAATRPQGHSTNVDEVRIAGDEEGMRPKLGFEEDTDLDHDMEAQRIKSSATMRFGDPDPAPPQVISFDRNDLSSSSSFNSARDVPLPMSMPPSPASRRSLPGAFRVEPGGTIPAALIRNAVDTDSVSMISFLPSVADERSMGTILVPRADLVDDATVSLVVQASLDSSSITLHVLQASPLDQSGSISLEHAVILNRKLVKGVVVVVLILLITLTTALYLALSNNNTAKMDVAPPPLHPPKPVTWNPVVEEGYPGTNETSTDSNISAPQVLESLLSAGAETSSNGTSEQPSLSPAMASILPKLQSSSSPSLAPSVVRSTTPSHAPSIIPSQSSRHSSQAPFTNAPSNLSSGPSQSSSNPSQSPSIAPSFSLIEEELMLTEQIQDSESPSSFPSYSPTANSSIPTQEPTFSPTPKPTIKRRTRIPTPEPTFQQGSSYYSTTPKRSPSPTNRPTTPPTNRPTKRLTPSPTPKPAYSVGFSVALSVANGDDTVSPDASLVITASSSASNQGGRTSNNNNNNNNSNNNNNNDGGKTVTLEISVGRSDGDSSSNGNNGNNGGNNNKKNEGGGGNNRNNGGDDVSDNDHVGGGG